MKKYIAAAVLLSIAGLGFRLFIALHLPNDAPDDGRLYARIALNVLEHRSYSIKTEEPYPPTFIRVPGYPLFLAGVYAVFGHDNNRAVRVVQAVLDTITCWLIALLALAWAPAAWDRQKRRRLLLIALGLAVSCPFLAIYVATILTETCTTLLATACALSATRAMSTNDRGKSAGWMAAAGLSGGLATLCRPDAGLFVAAVGSSVALIGLYRAMVRRTPGEDAVRDVLRGSPRQILGRTVLCGAMLAMGFGAALAPWTIRNARIFGVFQPIAPVQASMPGEFVANGYIGWLRTWVSDVKYTESFEWSLDRDQIHIEQVPDYAFDSPSERERVAKLLQQYNNPSPATSEQAAPTASAEPKPAVEMTLAVDSGFAELAREHIARNPIRYYLVVPLKRAASLWFDTHSQYYPFQGELFPLSALDTDLHQQYWLPFFSFLTALYTALGVAGAWLMWRDGQSRRWVLLLGLLIIPRLAFLASIANPEPRYVVEFFAFVLAACSISMMIACDFLDSRIARLAPPIRRHNRDTIR
jgi:Dolichyl-phosphate-mannose-protein mannosyltransferase